MTATVTKICVDLGVEFIRSNEAYRPMGTKCEAILNRIARNFGNDHLTLLLRTIVESDNNQMALVTPILWAVRRDTGTSRVDGPWPRMARGF